MNSEFRKALKAARIARGWTQGALGDAIGLATSTISMVEAGTRDTTGTHLFAWTEACGVRLVILPGSEQADVVEVGHLSAINRRRVVALVDVISTLHPSILKVVDAILDGSS